MKNSIIFVLCLLYISCSTKQDENSWRDQMYNNGIVKLLHEAYEQRNDTSFYNMCYSLNDSILAVKSLFWLKSTNYVFENSSKKKIVDWAFEMNQAIEFPAISSKYLYEICITNESNIIIENEQSNISEIRNLGKEYIFELGEKDANFEKSKDSIEYFGEIELSKVVGFLQVDLKSKGGLSVEEWRLFFNCLHELVLVFEDKRNEIAKSKWGVNYNSLPIDKKEAVYRVAGNNIMLAFDISCNNPTAKDQ